MTPGTLWLSCGVLRDELVELRRREEIEGELLFLDSMLHMDPPKLETALGAALREHDGEPSCLVLVYGDCAPRMLDLTRQFRVGRVNAINCAQLLVGKERYRQLMREEAFLVLPEWGRRWEQVVKTELGLSPSVARALIGENRGVLVYLDTGLVPVPLQDLADFSDYTGLPFRVETVKLEHLLTGLSQAQQRAAALRGGEERS